MTGVGVVIIGRNEGERLTRCLASALAAGAPVVYADSGSTDGSADAARSLGADVLPLDAARPFTAARGRNAGFLRLRQILPSVEYVQFLDGDTELSPGWLEDAKRFLDRHPDVAVVCGRRRERHPERSIYNALCDIEWDTPAGDALACGGDAMMRADALQRVGGFRDELIAGEEPEMCLRLRGSGWRIWRLDRDMTWHDAGMTRMAQWWRRSLRTGYAYAEGAHLHGGRREQPWVRETRRAWFWGLVLPLAGLGGIAFLGAPGALVFAAYPLQVARIALRGRRSARENWLCALFTVLGKFPELAGQLRFLVTRRLGIRSGLIEYK